MNVRWEAADIAMISAIAESEDRDFSYVVRFFVRHGIELFRKLGSLPAIELSFNAEKFHEEVDINAKARLGLREEAQILNGEQERTAASPRTRRIKAR